MRYKKSSSPDGTPRIEEVLADELYAAIGVRPEREYHFAAGRAWRFDLAYPDAKLAIEIAGRFHLFQKRFRQDCERNNWATLAGWTVLVFPASCVLAKSRRRLIVEQIHRKICGIFEPDLDDEILTGPLRKV